jgi:hypothetical protein
MERPSLEIGEFVCGTAVYESPRRRYGVRVPPSLFTYNDGDRPRTAIITRKVERRIIALFAEEWAHATGPTPLTDALRATSQRVMARAAADGKPAELIEKMPWIVERTIAGSRRRWR